MWLRRNPIIWRVGSESVFFWNLNPALDVLTQSDPVPNSKWGSATLHVYYKFLISFKFSIIFHLTKSLKQIKLQILLSTCDFWYTYHLSAICLPVFSSDSSCSSSSTSMCCSSLAIAASWKFSVKDPDSFSEGSQMSSNV